MRIDFDIGMFFVGTSPHSHELSETKYQEGVVGVDIKK